MPEQAYHAIKACRDCQEVKPLEQFDKNARTIGGRRNQCKACRKVYAAQNSERIAAYQRQWREENREHVAEYGRVQRETRRGSLAERRQGYYRAHRAEYRAANDAYKQRTNYAPRWRQEKRDDILAYQMRYRVEHVDQVRAASRRWAQANPGRRTTMVRMRRARRRAAEGSFTSTEWQALCARYGGRCLSCGSTDRRLTPDHVIPLSRGGSDWITNIQPMCLPCNQRKSTKIIDYR
jgi:5-methylcytosine-specific restriction endonuclease McrA